jgi:[phosphatase 2A protein]-leucine-carboxy methyltransferase
LPGADACPNFASLSNRFAKLAFDVASARTLKDVRATCIPRDELARISKLEMLDEVEELDLVLEHYAVTWALKRPGSVSVEDLQWVAWKAWGIQSREDATDHDNTM